MTKSVYVEGFGDTIDMWAPVFVQRDSAMNLLSYQEYGPYSYNGYMAVVKPSSDGKFVAAGNFSCSTEDNTNYGCNITYGRVIQVAPDLTLEWSVIDTAFYDDDLGSRCYLSGVATSPKGSIYAVGWANNYDPEGVYRSYGWLLKITADGCVDTLCTTTSILQHFQEKEAVVVYPNPSSGHLNVEIHDAAIGPLDFVLFDLSGRVVLRSPTDSNKFVVDVDQQPGGIYVWQVMQNGDGLVVASGKIVIHANQD
jgi:hypothetical protein